MTALKRKTANPEANIPILQIRKVRARIQILPLGIQPHPYSPNVGHKIPERKTKVSRRIPTSYDSANLKMSGESKIRNGILTLHTAVSSHVSYSVT